MSAHVRAAMIAAATVVVAACSGPGQSQGTQQAVVVAGGQIGLPTGSVTIPGLKQPFGVATEKGTAWVTEYEAGNLVRIDSSTNRIVARIHLSPHASHLVIQGGLAWVIDDLGGALISVDTRTNQVARSIPLWPGPELRPTAVAGDGSSIWAVLTTTFEYFANPRNTPPSRLLRIDQSSGQVLDTISLPGSAAGVAVGGGAVWVVSRLDPTLIYRVDPKAKAIAATIDTGHAPTGAIAYQEPYLWAANADGYLTRIDSRTNLATVFDVGSPEWPAIVPDGQSIWISAPLDNMLARFDPATGVVNKTVVAGTRPQTFAFLGRDVWVANYVDGTVVRLPIN
jgi:streptogramin lyase